MPVRVGFLSTAHMHSWGYAPAFASHPEAQLVGVWDDDGSRSEKFASHFKTRSFGSGKALLNEVDAVIITSENKAHADLAELAAEAGKHVLCEKPLVTNEEEGQRMMHVARKVKVMTAFPCRYSPAFQRLKQRVGGGEIGQILAACTTNRGSCPFGWFVETEKSGGGAMIDHVVHVADLLRDLLKDEVRRVQAQIGNNMYSQSWEDTAMVTLEFESGIFATLDSSWSRPKGYKTWGDVTMNVVGEGGVIELDMFGQALDVYKEGNVTHTLAGYGSGLDSGLVDDFLRSIIDDTEPPITAYDGLQAARVAMAGYESVRQGEPVDVLQAF